MGSAQFVPTMRSGAGLLLLNLAPVLSGPELGCKLVTGISLYFDLLFLSQASFVNSGVQGGQYGQQLRFQLAQG